MALLPASFMLSRKRRLSYSNLPCYLLAIYGIADDVDARSEVTVEAVSNKQAIDSKHLHSCSCGYQRDTSSDVVEYLNITAENFHCAVYYILVLRL